MKTRLFLVRHGPTHAKAMVGWSDIPADLSDLAALERLNTHLPSDALLVSSDLNRAIETASAIQGDRQRLPHQPGLREINFGAWELRTWKEVDAEDPDRIRAYWDTPGDVSAPGGESWNQVCHRVNAVVDHMIENLAGRNIVIVGHFGQILTQIQRAGAMTSQEAFAHKIDNLSVSEVSHDQQGWMLGKINQIL